MGLKCGIFIDRSPWKNPASAHDIDVVIKINNYKWHTLFKFRSLNYTCTHIGPY